MLEPSLENKSISEQLQGVFEWMYADIRLIKNIKLERISGESLMVILKHSLDQEQRTVAEILHWKSKSALQNIRRKKHSKSRKCREAFSTSLFTNEIVNRSLLQDKSRRGWPLLNAGLSAMSGNMKTSA